MDRHRGNNPAPGIDDDWPEMNCSEPAHLRELPPYWAGQDERRMQMRAYNHWARLRGTQNFPSIEKLTPAELPDLAPFGVLLDFTGGTENPAVAFLGSKLAEECGPNISIRARSDVPAGSLLARITDHCRELLINRAPIAFEAELNKGGGRALQYRGILLPFSSNQQNIDFVYGMINWKELADPATTGKLIREIEQALRASRPEKPGRPSL